MNETELKLKLEQICHEHQIERFQPDEIWEMLADGEDVAWLLGMLTENRSEAVEPLRALLAEISELIGPEPSEPEDAGLPAPEPAAQVLAAAAGAAIETQAGREETISPLAGFQLPPEAGDEPIEEFLNSPQGRVMGDFLMYCQEKGIDISNLQDDQKALRPYLDQWMDEPRPSFEGKTPRAMVEQNPELMDPGKVETYRRDQPKVGRNDPCPCGSGKKYKKCCGREE